MRSNRSELFGRELPTRPKMMDNQALFNITCMIPFQNNRIETASHCAKIRMRASKQIANCTR